jgi:hypothetical protein
LRLTLAERLGAVNVAAAVWLAAAPAHAHPEFAPNEINRYARFDLITADELRLAYTIMIGAAPALELRRTADANHDGSIDDAEAHALALAVAARARGELDLTVDGAPVAPAFEEPQIGLMGVEVAPSPFSVDLSARLRLGGAPPHTVRFDLRDPDRAGEIEVRIEEGPSTRLEVSHRGRDGDERQTRFLFKGPKRTAVEDRSILFRFAGVPPPASAKRMWAAPLAAALLAAAALLIWLKRKRP